MVGMVYRTFEAAESAVASELKRLLRVCDVSSHTQEDGITVVVGPVPPFAHSTVSEIAGGFGDAVLEVTA